MSNECFKIENGVLLSYRGGDATVTIPEGVTEIATGAFENCASLVTLRLSSTVSRIDKQAICRCPAFCELVFTATPATLRIHAEAWAEHQVTRVYIEDLAAWCATDHYYLKTYGETEYDDRFPPFSNATLYIGGRAEDTLVIPEGIARIGLRAFQMCGFSRLVLSEGVREIGDCAFSNSRSLKSVTCPSTLRDIGKEAFRGCAGLCDISFAEGLLHIGKQAFYDCEALSQVVFPRGLETIEYGAFGSIESLTTITFSTAVRSLNATFHDCPSLVSVTLPEGTEEIVRVFSACQGLRTVTLPSGLKILGESTFSCCYALTSIVLPEGVREIGDNAFAFCDCLTDIRLPSTLERVGATAFQGCAALETIEFPKATKHFGSSTFDYCKKLVSITAEGIEEVPDGFAGRCDKLARVTLSAHATSLGVGAFGKCVSLREITIPEGVTVIGKRAFSGCAALSSVRLPSTLIEIDENAFYECTSLSRVDTPPGLSKIGFLAFYGCRALSVITPPRGALQVASNAFLGCTSLEKPLTTTELPAGFCLFDDSINLPFEALDPALRRCYRYTETADADALLVEGVGHFALSPCTQEEYAVLMAACNAWRFVERYTSGLDANSDNGIYDVTSQKTYTDPYPPSCLYRDGRVLGFVDAKGRYFIIGERSDRWTIDLSTHSTGPYGEDEIDRTSYYIEERPK